LLEVSDLSRTLRASSEAVAPCDVLPIVEGDRKLAGGGVGSGSPDAYERLKKKASRRDVERFLATPVPPKTLGAGSLIMSVEALRKGSHIQGQSADDTIAKADLGGVDDVQILRAALK
jgi:hypothetical protein